MWRHVSFLKYEYFCEFIMLGRKRPFALKLLEYSKNHKIYLWKKASWKFYHSQFGSLDLKSKKIRKNSEIPKSAFCPLNTNYVNSFLSIPNLLLYASDRNMQSIYHYRDHKLFWLKITLHLNGFLLTIFFKNLVPPVPVTKNWKIPVPVLLESQVTTT
jgi:hypothetical protein